MIGEQIRKVRNNRQISQRKLAEKTGLHFTYICQVEAGRVPGTKNLIKLFTALKCNKGEVYNILGL